MSSGTFLILPWKHTIRYIVDTPSYLELGGVHIVPSYPQGLPFPFQVEHHRNENDGDDHSDWDRQIPELREIIVGHLSQSATLGYLLDYAVYRFQTGTLEEQQARLLGELMLLEWCRFSIVNPKRESPPANLNRLIIFIKDRLNQSLSIDYMAKIAGCSRASLNRMFRKHLQRTPIGWINEQRLKTASDLLRRTNLSVAEIGRKVGIPDPCRFSKLFRSHFQMSPGRWRKQMALYR